MQCQGGDVETQRQPIALKALNQSLPEDLERLERDFEFVETTELENEYLIDGFDVEADKVLEPNDTNSKQ